MDTIAVFVDDADHALKVLQPMHAARDATHWVLVACAPRLTHRIGKWVSHSSREQLRMRWATKLFEQLRPKLGGGKVETHLAKRPLAEVAAQLRSQYGIGMRVLDARRPKLGQTAESVSPASPNDTDDRWAVPIAVSSGLSVMLALSD
jgi:hypothetical protein